MCDVVDKDFARQLEIELAVSLENQCIAQAEVERLRAFIKSKLPPPPYGELEPEWKYAEKLLAETAPAPEEPYYPEKDLPTPDEEIAYAKSTEPVPEWRDIGEDEVAKLNHQLLKTESDLLQSQDINSFLDTEFRIACKRAEKAEAESELYKKSVKAYVHVCEPIRGMADKLGLRLGECIIQHGVPLLLESHKKAEAEVERLKLLLSDLLILTEKNYWDSSNYNQIKEAINSTDK
jgi:hypothetical protein